MWLYGADGDYLGFTLNGAEYYYVKNMQGDVVAIADENRNIVVVYTYNDYGKLESTSGTLAETVGALNPIRYRGYYYDTETGFYFLNSRYYDPQICRFINADVLLDNRTASTLNLYAYCGNNPIVNIDDDGHFFGAVIGGIIGGISGAISAAAQGKSVLIGAATGAATGAIIGALCDALPVTVAGVAIGAALCGLTAAAGNAANQVGNYYLERSKQNKAKNQKKTAQKVSQSAKSKNKPTSSKNGKASSGGKTVTSSNGKIASECSLGEYLDYKSIAISGVTAAIFAPISMGGGQYVSELVSASGYTGGLLTAMKFGGDSIVGGTISIFQSLVDYFFM